MRGEGKELTVGLMSPQRLSLRLCLSDPPAAVAAPRAPKGGV